MKRNDIYYELKSIMKSLYNGNTDISIMKLSSLIEKLDTDRHEQYDSYEMLEDLEERYKKMEAQLIVLQKDLEFMKDPNNLRKSLYRELNSSRK